ASAYAAFADSAPFAGNSSALSICWQKGAAGGHNPEAYRKHEPGSRARGASCLAGGPKPAPPLHGFFGGLGRAQGATSVPLSALMTRARAMPAIDGARRR